jgi:hypothetical protein
MRRSTAAVGITFVLSAALLLLLPGAADTHTRVGETWYWDGRTYDADDPTQREDVVNVIFAGGPNDTSAYTRTRIEFHMADDWNHARIGGSAWRPDSFIANYCKTDQRMYWEDGPARTSDLTDWHGSTATHAEYCGPQHHGRFWDDQEHARQTGDHGPEDQWALAAMHHEKVIRKNPLGHKIDRDWDTVRRETVRAMGAHCSESTWRYHPDVDGGNDNLIRGWQSLGFMARISLRHRSSGSCEGW